MAIGARPVQFVSNLTGRQIPNTPDFDTVAEADSWWDLVKITRAYPRFEGDLYTWALVYTGTPHVLIKRFTNFNHANHYGHNILRINVFRGRDIRHMMPGRSVVEQIHD